MSKSIAMHIKSSKKHINCASCYSNMVSFQPSNPHINLQIFVVLFCRISLENKASGQIFAEHGRKQQEPAENRRLAFVFLGFSP